MNSRCLRAVVFIFAHIISSCSAGTIILGGDDFTDHGNYVPATGELFRGWKYLALVLPLLHDESSVPGRNGDIVLLGSSATDVRNFGNGDLEFDNDAYEGYYRALESVGLLEHLRAVEGPAAIASFLEDLYAGRERPSVVAIAGSEASNDLDIAEAAALNQRGDALQMYARRGGSMISHGSSADIDVYGWLAELANITHINECDSDGATLTPTAQLLYGDNLQNTDIDITAGPCHDSFTPSDGITDFQAFQPLAVDAAQRVFLLIARGSLVERTVIRLNCSADTSEEGEFIVRLPMEAGSSDYFFELPFDVPQGTSGSEFEELLVNTLEAYRPFTELDDLDCSVSIAGAFQASCPISVNIRLMELCFDGQCENINSESGFYLNGLGCPEPPCPVCDGIPDDDEPICDTEGNYYASECQFDSTSCLFPGERVERAPCPTPAVTASPTAVPTTAPPTPVQTNAPSPAPTLAPTTNGTEIPGAEGGGVFGADISSSGGVAGTELTLGGLIGVIVAAVAAAALGLIVWKRKQRVGSPPAQQI